MTFGWLVTTGALHVLGWALLHSLWQSAILAVGLAALLRALPASRPAARSRATAAAALLALGLFLLTTTVLLADWRDHAVCWEMAADPTTTAPATCASHGVDVTAPGTVDLPAYRAVLFALPQIAPPTHALRRPARVATRATAGLAAVWFGVVALITLRGLRRRRSRRHLIDSRQITDPGTVATLERLGANLGIRRPVVVRESARIASPGVTGWRTPTILMPSGLLRTLGDAEREAVLAHELAHVARVDVLIDTLLRLAETALWFNPFLRWMAARHREEREATCDRLALGTAPVSARAYGETLLVLEGFRGLRNTPGIALPLLGETRLLTRIRRLRARPRPGRLGGLAVAAAVVALAALLLASSARTVALTSWAIMVEDGQERLE